MATPIHRIGPSPNGSEAHSRLEFGVSKGGQRVTCSVCFSRRAAATARQRTDCPVCHVAAAHRMLLVVQLVHGSRGIFPRAKSIPCRQAARVNSAAGAYLCDCNCARGWAGAATTTRAFAQRHGTSRASGWRFRWRWNRVQLASPVEAMRERYSVPANHTRSVGSVPTGSGSHGVMGPERFWLGRKGSARDATTHVRG